MEWRLGRMIALIQEEDASLGDLETRGDLESNVEWGSVHPDEKPK